LSIISGEDLVEESLRVHVTQEIIFVLIAIAAPYQTFEVLGLDHAFVMFLYRFGVVLPTERFVVRLKLSTKDTYRVRVIMIIPHFFSLNSKLYLESVYI